MFEQAFKKIDDILRKDAGVSSELDYIEQTSWLLFLKYLDALEQERAQIAELHGQDQRFLLEKPYRWHTWAMPPTQSEVEHELRRACSFSGAGHRSRFQLTAGLGFGSFPFRVTKRL